MASISDDSGTPTVSLTGFLFGNIDASGQLVDDDVLDEDSRRHLDGLSALGVVSPLVDELKDVAEYSDNDESHTSSEPLSTLSTDLEQSVDIKADDALDYSDISEMVEDTDGSLSVKLESERVENGDIKSEPPQCGASDRTVETDTNHVKIEISSPKITDVKDTSHGGLQTPLAVLLPPELADHDVRRWFPEFRPGKVLRFSRLFRPSHVPHVWKRKKKKPATPTAASEKPVSDKKNSVAPSADTKHSESDKATDNESMEIITDEDMKNADEPSFKLNLGRKARPEELAQDDEALLLSASALNNETGGGSERGRDAEPHVAEWRYGPAQLWYDMLGISESGEGFDYGFQLKQASQETEDKPSGNCSFKVEYPDEAFLMVTQVQWEDEVIWDGEKARDRVMMSLRQRGPAAGWIPSTNARTMQQYMQQMAAGGSGPLAPGWSGTQSRSMISQLGDGAAATDTWHSIFPIENEALIYGRWEDDVIWDAQAMDYIPQPSVLTLDPNDEHLILEIPEDRDAKVDAPSSNVTQETTSTSKKDNKRSRILLGKAGILKEDEGEQNKEDEAASSMQNKDPFNLSNDEYYNPKLTTDVMLSRNLGASIIQHSTPAVELRQPFFPTHVGPIKLRGFHRPPLKRYSHGAMTGPGPHPVLPLLKQIRRKEKLREQERLASGGGEMFFMRTADDLTGRDGEVILAEYSEQYPPLINQVGMALKIRNYYKRRPGKETNTPEFKYGDLAYAHTSPFLGNLAPGQCLQTFENNMFRAPVFEHKVPFTDFLIIRNRMHYYIREVETVFAVGQQCPLMEVPGPNSKRANNFARDFLQVFVYRQFWHSKDEPRRIKMDDVRKAFPSHSESSIRKRLKLCADFKRTGMDSNWWVLKSDFRLPTEEEIRAAVSPEQCCAYYCMLAAEQRLKDAGYGEKSLFAPEDDNEEDSATKIDDEVKAAPWNTTRAFIAAMKGRCLLALTGVADPTGCGEGFSYVKVPNKPAASRTADEIASHHTPVKRTVTGTDADLRRLSLKDAKQLLRKFGVAEAEIKKLSRWEVIDVVRTMSTEQAKLAAAQEDGDTGISKFARGNRFSVAEHQERYKEECQRVFDLQNRVLTSDEILSTDDDSSSDDDSDFEEISKNIESMLANKKTSTQISLEREEAERLELRRMIQQGSLLDGSNKDRKDRKGDSSTKVAGGGPQTGIRKLRITRTFRNDDGGEFTRTEIVSKHNVIDAYIRIRDTKDASFIRQFTILDDQAKEEMKKERRRIQEQLRRIKRNQAAADLGLTSAQARILSASPAKKRMKLTPLKLAKLIKAQRLRCGACGQKGHMRTNRECPLYNGSVSTNTGNSSAPGPAGPLENIGPVAMSEEQEEQLEKSNLVDEDLINIEGVKVKISKQLVKHTEEVKRRSLVLKFPKVAAAAAAAAAKKNRRMSGLGSTSTLQCDYLKKPTKVANRRRADPVVTLSTILETILNEMRDMPNVQLFLQPVNPKLVPDYYNIIRYPMDLQTIRSKLRAHKYVSRESFLVDVNQIVSNCELYNGPRHSMTAAAQRMMDLCLQRVAEKEEKLMRLEKAINPLLDDDDMVALSFIFTTVIEDRLMKIEGSYPFHNPVNRKQQKNYYELIRSPIDLSTMMKKVKEHRYQTRVEFEADVELMAANCEQFNGPNSILTQTARRVVEVCRAALDEQADTMRQLEENVLAARQAALDAADTDSVITATSAATGDVESVVSAGQALGASLTAADTPAAVDHPDLPSADDAGARDAAAEEEEDFIDVVGDDETGAEAPPVEDSLERDLQMTPENSGDEEDNSFREARLSSSGSDSETSDFRFAGGSEQQSAAEVMTYEYDENAQDYVGYVDLDDGVTGAEFEPAAAAAYDDDDDDGENSFDPQAFFSSFAQNALGTADQQTDAAPAAGDDINTDLQVSDSDDSEAGLVAVDDDDDASNQDFDMAEFLKQP